MTTPAPGSSPSTAPAPADAGSRVVPLVDLHGRSAWSILPPLILGFFMIMVDTTIVNIAVPTLQTELDASLVAVGWVVPTTRIPPRCIVSAAGTRGRSPNDVVFAVPFVPNDWSRAPLRVSRKSGDESASSRTI